MFICSLIDSTKNYKYTLIRVIILAIQKSHHIQHLHANYNIDAKTNNENVWLILLIDGVDFPQFKLRSSFIQ